MHGLKYKFGLAAVLLAAVCVCISTVDIYLSIRHELRLQLAERLKGAARLAAEKIDPVAHEAVRAGGSLTSRAYVSTQEQLHAVMADFDLQQPIVTLRPAMDDAMTYVVSSDGAMAIGDTYPLLDAMRLTLQQGETVATEPYMDDKGEWLSAYAPIRAGDGPVLGLVKVDYHVGTWNEQIQERMRYVYLLSASLLLLAVGLGTYISRWLTRPVLALADAADEVKEGNFRIEVPVTSKDEIGKLTESFNEMVSGLRERERIKRAFGTYIAPQVADKLMDFSDVRQVEGERRQITVLLTDIRGFTEISEQCSPEEIVSSLNDYFKRVIDVVFEYEGTIDKFMGDALLAYFGAPLHQPDHRQRALKASRDIQIALGGFNAQRKAEGKFPMETGIGLAVGEAVVGNIGSDKRLEYTIIGDVVNLASRLTAVAKGGQVIASNDVLYGLREEFEARKLAPVMVKGFRHPMPISDVQFGPAK